MGVQRAPVTVQRHAKGPTLYTIVPSSLFPLATTRNRIKRRIREAYRRTTPEEPLVVRCAKGADSLTVNELCDVLRGCKGFR